MAKQYGWNDTSVVVLGRTIEGIENVSWTRSVSKERYYGRGGQTLDILSGNEEISGSLTIHQSELEAFNLAIKAVNPSLDITKVSFDIIINYEVDGVSTTDRIVGAQVESYEKALAQNDKKMAIELPFMAVAAYEGV
jgi:hypothetical protein